jgi:hypothetical protein
MTELTASCTRCSGRGKGAYDEPCPACNAGHTLTPAGEQVKKFILTLLADPDIQAKVAEFVKDMPEIGT